jgi:hypothetical protein
VVLYARPDGAVVQGPFVRELLERLRIPGHAKNPAHPGISAGQHTNVRAKVDHGKRAVNKTTQFQDVNLVRLVETGLALTTRRSTQQSTFGTCGRARLSDRVVVTEGPLP